MNLERISLKIEINIHRKQKWLWIITIDKKTYSKCWQTRCSWASVKSSQDYHSLVSVSREMLQFYFLFSAVMITHSLAARVCALAAAARVLFLFLVQSSLLMIKMLPSKWTEWRKHLKMLTWPAALGMPHVSNVCEHEYHISCASNEHSPAITAEHTSQCLPMPFGHKQTRLLWTEIFGTQAMTAVIVYQSKKTFFDFFFLVTIVYWATQTRVNNRCEGVWYWL